MTRLEEQMALGTAIDRVQHAAGETPLFVGSQIYRRAAWGAHHPLAIPRHATVMDLCRILGWLEGSAFVESGAASVEQLERFHDRGYIDALRDADERGRVDSDICVRYRIGTMENPLFPGLYERAATTVGGSILAAELALGGRVVFHPSGGTHHGRPGHASGFCYFNDPVFALLTLLDAGLERVLYVDLDAHHGDAVQDAFAEDHRVFTISIHEADRWPYSGKLEDRGYGEVRNLPVPSGFNDSELDYLMQETVLPLAARFDPQAVVVTCGADGLDGDPLSGMALSNLGLWAAVERLTALSTPSVVLGGGGYNPWTVSRCWAGLWGRLSGREIPSVLPEEAQTVLRGLECDLVDEDEFREEWITTLADSPRPGAIREEIMAVARAVNEP